MHDHSHHHHSLEINSKNLFITMLLNILITVSEIIGGIISGSLSLISDALHNFTDFIAVLISYISFKLSKRPGNVKKTFGYKRAQILAGLFNTAILTGTIIYLFIEAIHRIINPINIKASMVILIASFGLLANTLSVFLLKKDSKHNLNVKSAYLHLLTDALSSLVVIIGAIFIYFFKVTILDPLLTILIGLYVLKESYGVIKETVNILMQGTPKGINVYEIEKQILTIPQIKEIHHVHIWQLDDKNIHFEAHIVVDKLNVSETDPLIKTISRMLLDNYKINHCIFQFECTTCENSQLVNFNCYNETCSREDKQKH